VKAFFRTLVIPVAVVCALASTARATTAPTTVVNAIGSSALFLELGEAAYAKSTLSCAWSSGGKAVATDTSNGAGLTDSGNTWAVWVRVKSTDTCANPVNGVSAVYGYLQTDSVVGNRCLFNAQLGKCSISYAASSGTAPGNLIEPTKEVALPAVVANYLTAQTVNMAGTDIRPEDAAFATTRALTSCGSTTTPSGGSIAPYLGLGYNPGDKIHSAFSTSTFNVLSFTLPTNYYVQPVGLDPIMVAVNSTDALGTGFHNTAITNINSSTLALFLDGSIGSTSALIPTGSTGIAEPVTVMIREPLSGTYNTMEYNVPNTSVMQTSQDVGVNQLASQKNCSGQVPASNPMNIANAAAGSVRLRAIGTGEELKEVFNLGGYSTADNLGYAFWGVSNFATAPATAKYLTVDGYDPIVSSYSGTAGVIPTTTSELSKVNFYNLITGNYPIWSLIRLVTVDSNTASIAHSLALSAGTYSTTAHPDFVPYYTNKGLQNVPIERSHFAPPGIGFTATVSNAGDAPVTGYGACGTAEAGGDVGGVILNIAAVDQLYCADTGSTAGIVGRRK
jgi:hypothetical protein